MKLSRVGVDLAKNVYQLHGVDRHGKTAWKRRLRRGQWLQALMDNATLTIFRHFDAATVVKGLVGPQPQTAWVLTYPLFERIHYLLVAGYDVYGNGGHQLNSRMYMDFLRMEGEFNFLAFLPLDNRKKVRKHWYRGSVSEVEKFVFAGNTFDPISDINYKTDEPLGELYALLKQHFSALGSPPSQPR